jgi:hypothetical protein
MRRRRGRGWRRMIDALNIFLMLVYYFAFFSLCAAPCDEDELK